MFFFSCLMQAPCGLSLLVVLENSGRKECLGDFSVVKKFLHFLKKHNLGSLSHVTEQRELNIFLRLQLILKLKCGPKDPTYERPVKFLKEMGKMLCLSILK